MPRREKQELEIDVSSFSDIAFLLIIFFILTTQIVRFTGNTISVPSGQPTKEQKKEDKQITINLESSTIQYSDGKNTEPVSLEELKAKLLRENFPALPEEKRFVILDSKGDVPYEVYFKVVMLINETGGILSLIDYEEPEGSK
ncbi:MAG: hypothetical protein A2X49_17235 [Lentisphaerae bacterium GWF2_52_8]|nr:MAG: hypothetical protein A2X49_17235 [Lentisphaerae bacterium GWF2_52_8]